MAFARPKHSATAKSSGAPLRDAASRTLNATAAPRKPALPPVPRRAASGRRSSAPAETFSLTALPADEDVPRQSSKPRKTRSPRPVEAWAPPSRVTERQLLRTIEKQGEALEATMSRLETLELLMTQMEGAAALEKLEAHLERRTADLERLMDQQHRQQHWQPAQAQELKPAAAAQGGSPAGAGELGDT